MLLANQLNVMPALAAALHDNGLVDARKALQFFHPQLSDLPSPWLMAGMEEAVATLLQAVERKISVVLYGDYDVDGTTGLALLAIFLRTLGCSPLCFQPNRLLDGYGLSKKAIDEVCSRVRGPGLLLTVDCGITSIDEVNYLKNCGFSVIITDHHEPDKRLPEAAAVLNPRRCDCSFPCKNLAGVGVAFFLAAGVRSKLIERGIWKKHSAPNLKQLLDLVALGTVADVMPLTGCNRLLVRAGLEVMQNTNMRPGLESLLILAGVRPRDLIAEDISFRLAPRINAAGRLGDAKTALDLLCAQSRKEAEEGAAALERVNNQRKQLEENSFITVLQDCQGQVDKGSFFLVHLGNHHPGIIGILASRVVSRLGRPVLVFTEDKANSELIKGSGRSCNEINLYEEIGKYREYFEQIGGHRLAIGITMKKENYSFIAAALASLDMQDFSKNIVNAQPRAYPVFLEDLADERKLHPVLFLQPCGQGNEEPLFVVGNVKAESIALVGQAHLSFYINSGKRRIRAIAFNQADRVKILKERANLYFKLRLNSFKGESRWQLLIEKIEAIN